MTERDWKTFSAAIFDSETRPSPSMADGEHRRESIFVIAEGDPGQICPAWGALRESGRVETVIDIEALAWSSVRIPAGHPANLVEAFPRALELDCYLGTAAAAGFIAAACLGAVVLGGMRQARAADESDRARVRILQGRIDELNRNHREIERLRSEAPDGSGPTVGCHDALVGLAAAVPDPLTLTSFTLERDGGFELEAIVVGEGFSPDDTRRALVRCGFTPSSSDGWVYDSAAGRLVARGTYKEGRP